jgi:hypothetical protein
MITTSQRMLVEREEEAVEQIHSLHGSVLWTTVDEAIHGMTVDEAVQEGIACYTT